MSSLSRASIAIERGFLPALLFAVLGLVVGADALAIDGNYASPYATQYDTRSTGATVPNLTWFGLLLLLLNFATAALAALRHRRRKRAA